MSGDQLFAYAELRQLFRSNPHASDADAADLAELDLANPDHAAFIEACRDDAAREAGPGTE